MGIPTGMGMHLPSLGSAEPVHDDGESPSSEPADRARALAAASPRLVALDLDGTLVDTVPDIAWCIDRTMPRFGVEPRGEALVRRWVGNGVERLVERALTSGTEVPAEPALLREACGVFLDLYARHGRDRSRVYPGVHEGIAALRAHGAVLVCITNKPRVPAVDLLAHLALLDSFELVIGGDSLPRRKPDPLPLLHACSVLGTGVGDSVFVGDSINDVQAARAAGMRVACVSYGYNHGRDIAEAAPDAVIDSLEELAPLYFGAPGRRPRPIESEGLR